MRVALVLAVFALVSAGCNANPTAAPVNAPAGTAGAVTEAPAATSAPTAAMSTPSAAVAGGSDINEIAGVELATCEKLRVNTETNATVAAATVQTYVQVATDLLEGKPFGDPPQVYSLSDSERAALQKSLDGMVEGGMYCGIVPVDRSKW